MKGTIYIEGIKCHAYHGCLAEESIIGGMFTVDVIISMDLRKAATEDELSKTADYVLVHALVNEEMKIASKLIEHAAGRILLRLTTEFSSAENITVKLKKHDPPVNGSLDSATVILSLK
jgi:dihydroneopterin aldolase